MTDLLHFMTSIPWFAWIAIVAIVCGAVTQTVAMQHKHAERLAMIQQGMNPDAGKHAGVQDV